MRDLGDDIVVKIHIKDGQILKSKIEEDTNNLKSGIIDGVELVRMVRDKEIEKNIDKILCLKNNYVYYLNDDDLIVKEKKSILEEGCTYLSDEFSIEELSHTKFIIIDEELKKEERDNDIKELDTGIVTYYRDARVEKINELVRAVNRIKRRIKIAKQLNRGLEDK